MNLFKLFEIEIPMEESIHYELGRRTDLFLNLFTGTF